MKVPVEFRGRFVGYIEGSAYHTPRESAKHKFYKFQGYGISLQVLEKLRWSGVEQVKIYEDRVRILVSSLDEWFGAERYTYQGDEQRILPVSRMREESRDGGDGRLVDAAPLQGPSGDAKGSAGLEGFWG